MDKMEEAKRIISECRIMEKNALLQLMHTSGSGMQYLLPLYELASRGFSSNGKLVGRGPAANALPKNYFSEFNKCLGRQ